MTPIKGVDISVYQWRNGLPYAVRKAMLADGIRFLIARSSIGNATDPAFARTRQRSKPFDAFGAYHYLTDRQSGVDQADTFAGIIKATGGVAGLLTVLDVEDDHTGPIWNEPERAEVKAFARRFAEHFPKHQLGVYANRSTWFRLGNPDIQAMGFDWAWNAYWTGAPPFPSQPPVGFGGEGRIQLWQYGLDRITIQKPGKPASVIRIDGNAWYGTVQQLQQLGKADRPPITERPAYVAARNAELEQLEAAIKLLPAPSGKPIQIAGIMAARDAAQDALAALRTGKE